MESLNYKIEDNIPLMKANKGKRTTDPQLERALQMLLPGQSLYVPNTTGDHLMPLQHKVICTISKIKKELKLMDRPERTLVTRQHGNGIRVWRTA